jgi:hypothetical protein
MNANELLRLQAEKQSAEADVLRVRAENDKLAEAFRAEPTEAARELLKRGALSLAAARDRLDAANVALAVFRKTGSPHGLVAEAGRVVGSIAVAVPPGAGREERARVIDLALAEPLAQAASDLGVVLGAAPERFVRERPGRDESSRTVLDVGGRVEGDVLLPAVSRAAKNLRG